MALTTHLARITGPVAYRGSTGQPMNIPLGPCLLVVNESAASERRAKRRPIQAQSADMARAMASICNDERAYFGGASGRG